MLGFLLVGILALSSGCTKDSGPTDPDTGRDAFLGRWSVTETETKLTYEVVISADALSTDGVLISNFAGLGTSSVPAGASVSGTSITLDPNQVISGFTINGSGNLTGTKINWNYTMNNGADLITLIAVYTKL